MKPDETEATPAPEITTVRLDTLATTAGLLPENLPSGSSRVQQNPKFWFYRAICVRYRWDEHTQVTQQDFDAALKAVAHFSV